MNSLLIVLTLFISSYSIAKEKPGETWENAEYFLKTTQLTEKITGNDLALGSRFGYSISLSENRALIGAPGDAADTGAAYLFELIDGNWIQSQKLTSSDGAAGDNFGYSVSLDGDRALIGAYLDDDTANESGSAYIFELSGDTWIETSKLTADAPVLDDNFGFSVSLSGSRALIGSPFTDNSEMNSGSAYVFDLSAGIWSQTQELVSNSPVSGGAFGYAVSLDVDRALIGGRNGVYDGKSSGIAEVHELGMPNWVFVDTLFPADGIDNDHFGVSVSLDGDFAVVGASLNDEADINAGAAYIFQLSEGIWFENDKLLASDAASNDLFGISVAIKGNQVITGATLEETSATDSGAAYIFDFYNNQWSQSAKISADIEEDNDFFGQSVSLSSSQALVGAYQTDQDGNGAGSAFAFHLDLFPTANDDTLTVLENASTTNIQILSNDSDFDNGPLQVIAITQPANGVAAFSSSLVSYTPNPGYCNDNEAQDTFSYTLNGGSVGEIFARVICTYELGGTVSGLDDSESVSLSLNGLETVILSNNETYNFNLQLQDMNHYDVQILSQPANQTCVLMNSSGEVSSADVTDLDLSCNTAPTTAVDLFEVLEDGILSIADGVIFVNDSDPEFDGLSVSDPGLFQTLGATGFIEIEANGAFDFIPDDDLNGTSTFDYEITDGLNTVPAQLQIEILAVNDSPSFFIPAELDLSEYSRNSGEVVITDIISDFVPGPDNESLQTHSGSSLTVISDFNNVFESLSIESLTGLRFELTGNFGVVVVHINVQDNGGVINGGIDTSEPQKLLLYYTENIFENGFD